ncbi:hypothetical protein C2S51_018118 [Perilla frutescens var. frutescens]|nr:hypothetical protein C2S51_018118 [Perilla frutescens var. frutescens]
MDLLSLAPGTVLDKRALDFVSDLQAIHASTQEHLEQANARHKAATDVHHRDVQFEVGDLVWAILTRDRFPAHEYNKLVSHKIGPLEVVAKINPNAYRVKLPNGYRTSDVFNVKHLVPYLGHGFSRDETSVDSRTNPFQERENDGDETARQLE